MAQAKEHQGRLAVITGGIGGAIARRLTREEVSVHVLDVNGPA